MKIKGIGPRNLGAPKAVAKQTKDSRSGKYAEVEPIGTAHGSLTYPQVRLGKTQYGNNPNMSLYNNDTGTFEAIPFSATDSINAIEDTNSKKADPVRNKDYEFEVFLDEEMKKRKLNAKNATRNLLKDLELNNRYGGEEARAGSFNEELTNYTGEDVFTLNQLIKTNAERDKIRLDEIDRNKLKRFKRTGKL